MLNQTHTHLQIISHFHLLLKFYPPNEQQIIGHSRIMCLCHCGKTNKCACLQHTHTHTITHSYTNTQKQIRFKKGSLRSKPWLLSYVINKMHSKQYNFCLPSKPGKSNKQTHTHTHKHIIIVYTGNRSTLYEIAHTQKNKTHASHKLNTRNGWKSVPYCFNYLTTIISINF